MLRVPDTPASASAESSELDESLAASSELDESSSSSPHAAATRLKTASIASSHLLNLVIFPPRDCFCRFSH